MNKEEALKILGLNANPSEQEIKKAYRKLALEYHPDKHSGESKDVQKQNEEKFKELGAAYNFLTGNDVKEATTFSGEDLDRVSSTDDLLILLCFAILKKQKDFLEKLLSRFKSGEGEEFGDYINEKNFTTFDNSPLYIACLPGYTDIVTLLLKHKANPDLSKDYTPLLTACSMGRADVVEILLKYKANPDLSKDVTPLQIACLKGRADIVEVLLKYKANPDLSKDVTPLFTACSMGYTDIVEVLLKYKANPDLSKDVTPLCTACSMGYTDIVEVLLKYKANPDLSKDDTPLFTACSMGYTDIVEVLLKYKANPDLSKDVTPLFTACSMGYTDIVEVLLKYKANPDLSKDVTPLFTACSMGYTDIVEVLLKYKANPDLSSGTNNSRPLFTITCLYMSDSDKENYIKITELLLKYGADPNTLKGNTRIIEFAEINILKSTFMLHGNNKIRKLMVQYGGVERYYLFTCGLFATFFTSCMIIHVSSIYKLSNYEIPICVFAILFFTYRALEAAFFAKTKEPSPEFAEVITEKVVNNVGLNAEDNSKRIDNALA